ncbi:MAG: DUF2252 domain-containing protein [Rhodococcus sp. (in: high G+C Gram-positive bacteria)]|uniref:DUF2252 domain-containing protein n=1 Tax=Rhodococcus sp. EPR-157 TaxID=1813677 RepID=UPI0007BB1366|nr:DUF2252 domain-containing protein [Rhodococcus sp. EPR-157]KZF12837.1 hypothetical protein A2J03_16940 [Rhodococcus sp. EPR-157]
MNSPTDIDVASAREGIAPSEHPARGRQSRKRVSRRQLAEWNPDARGHDALATILGQNELRVSELLPIRHARMAASPWTYFRGAAAVMAADLASAPNTGIEVQLCGDAHVLNFGLWATPERNLYFDLRDFDETLPGPFEWDVKRLATSLVVLGRENGVDEGRADRAVAAMMASYRNRMWKYASMPEIDIWYDRIDVAGLLGHFSSGIARHAEKLIETKAERRTSRGASRKFTETRDGRRRIREDPPFRTHVGDAQLELIQAVIAGYSGSVNDSIWSLLSRFRVLDVVRQVVGVGSVGMRVYLAFLEETRTGDPFFLQIKQAGPSVFEQFLRPSKYDNHGARVVNGQRMLQSATDMFVGWTSVGEMNFYVRQFRDMKVIPDGEIIGPHLTEFATACGEVLARAHARSGDAAAIADYIGRGDKVDRSMVDFAHAYADQNERDHAQLVAAIQTGSVPSSVGW